MDNRKIKRLYKTVDFKQSFTFKLTLRNKNELPTFY